MKHPERFRLRNYLSDFGILMVGAALGMAFKEDWIRCIALLAIPMMIVGLGLLRDYKGIDIRIVD